jgi:hypothetical protein
MDDYVPSGPLEAVDILGWFPLFFPFYKTPPTFYLMMNPFCSIFFLDSAAESISLGWKG